MDNMPAADINLQGFGCNFIGTCFQNVHGQEPAVDEILASTHYTIME
jgi:hypothetical protein